jgi:type IV secretion system protein VirD4
MWLIGLGIAAFAFGYFLSTAPRRRRARQRTTAEIETARQTAMPTVETALGRIARDVAAAQEEKLRSPPPIHGTARWANGHDVYNLVDGNQLRSVTGTLGLRLGTLMADDGADTGPPLVARYPGHLLTVAGTGQGKSATQIVDNLMNYAGSVVVVDPKGELYDLTAERRRRFGNVYRLAPLAEPNEPPSDHYNPLAELGEPRGRASMARFLVEMLIVRQGDKGASNATFFENEAVNLLTALVMHVMAMTEPDEMRDLRTLGEVRTLCTQPLLGKNKQRSPHVRVYFEDTLAAMMKSGNRYVRSQGSAFFGQDPELLGSFLSEINSNLAFFDGHPGYEEMTSNSDFQFADLAKRPTSVYLTIPLQKMNTEFRFLRAMVGMAFAALREQREATEASVLFVLDEFPALRDMPFMRDAVAQMRSSGAWFWFFVQDVAQLEGVYGDWAHVFLSQTDHQIFFGATSDPRTKKHVSTNLGVSTFAFRDPSISWSHTIGNNDNVNAHPTQLPGSSDGRNVGQSINVSNPVTLAPRPLLSPFEVGTFLSERRPGESHPTSTIIFSKQANGFPIRARRQHWRSLPQVDVRPTAPTTTALVPIARSR